MPLSRSLLPLELFFIYTGKAKGEWGQSFVRHRSEKKIEENEEMQLLKNVDRSFSKNNRGKNEHYEVTLNTFSVTYFRIS